MSALLPHRKTSFIDGCVIWVLVNCDLCVFDSLFRQGEPMTLENVVKTTKILIKWAAMFYYRLSERRFDSDWQTSLLAAMPERLAEVINLYVHRGWTMTDMHLTGTVHLIKKMRIKCRNNKWHVHILTQNCHYLVSLDFPTLSLTQNPFRFGRPGVECYCQHETGAAVIQLQFLINEVSVSHFSPSFCVLLNLMLRAYSHGASSGSLNNPGWSLKRLRWSLNPEPLLPQTLLSSRVGLEGSYRGSWYYHFLPRVLPTVKTTGISYIKLSCRLCSLVSKRLVHCTVFQGFSSWIHFVLSFWGYNSTLLCAFAILVSIFQLCTTKRDIRC